MPAKPFLSFLLCCFLIGPVYAQQSPYRTALRIEPIRALTREFVVSIERRPSAQSNTLRFGYFHRAYVTDYLAEGIMMISPPWPKYHGPSVAYQHSFYFRTASPERYVFALAEYRYLWYNHQTVWLEGRTDANKIELSQWRNEWIFGLGYGKQELYERLISGGEFGLGLRVFSTHTNVFDCTYCTPGGSSSPEQAEKSLSHPEGIGYGLWFHLTWELGGQW